MKAPWTAERVVDEALARALVEAQFADLRGASYAPLGVGWDNTAWLVGGAWVFRFPRREMAVPLLEREVRCLATLAPRLPLRIPVVERAGRPGERFPWPFAGYRRLPGRTACAAALDDGQRAEMAPALGRFLRALHAAADFIDAGPDLFAKMDLPKRAAQAREGFDALERAGLLLDRARLERVLGAAEPRAVAPALVHGDLYVRHLLVDDCGSLCGVIDWGDLHLGDPAVDLAIAHLVLPRSAHDAFRRAYGPIDEPTWALATFRAAFHASRVAQYARDVGDADLLREALWALARIG